MNYNQDYPKLENKVYTSIRAELKNRHIGLIVPAKVNGIRKHFANIIKIERKLLEDIETKTLLLDTNTKTRKKAYNLIKSIYSNLNIKTHNFFIFTFKQLEKLSHKEKVRRARL